MKSPRVPEGAPEEAARRVAPGIDCVALCQDDPYCTGVTDYFWLDEPGFGCYLYRSTCDAPTMPDWAEEDGGKDYKKVCDG